MKKKDLMLFLDKVEHKAIKSVEEKYEVLIKIEMEKVLKDAGYTERINKIQKKINDMFQEVQEIVLDLKEDITVRCDDYYNAAYYMQNLAGKDAIKQRVLNNSKFDGGPVQLIRDEKNKEIKLVKANYSKVKVVCQDMLQASKIAEYLKGLGFDLSSLEQAENNKLIPEIDKTKLFVCGENN